MIIRKATIQDFEQIKKIRNEFYLNETRHDKLSDPDWVNRGMGITTAKALKSKKHIFFVAEDKGKIIGYCSGEIEKNPSFFKFKKKCHLYNVFLKEEHRGKGIGKKLILSVMNWFKKNKIKCVRILVYTRNKKAYSIYKKLGFEDYMITMTKIIK